MLKESPEIKEQLKAIKKVLKALDFKYIGSYVFENKNIINGEVKRYIVGKNERIIIIEIGTGYIIGEEELKENSYIEIKEARMETL